MALTLIRPLSFTLRSWLAYVKRTFVSSPLEAALDHAGWRVLKIWECSLKGTGRIGIDRVVPLAADWLRSGERAGEIRGTVRAGG